MKENQVWQPDKPETVRLLLNPKDAARALSICPRKLWGLTKSKAIRSIRIGHSVRYEVAALQAFIAEQSQKSVDINATVR